GVGERSAHRVLAAPPERAHRHAGPGNSAQVLCRSAKTEGALRELAAGFSDFLLRTDVALGDICFTANTGRAHFDHRLAIVGKSCRDVGEKLAQQALVARSRRNGDAVQQHDSAAGGAAANETRLNEVAESYVR